MPDKSKKLREAYARDITRRAGIKDARVREAFGAVPREDFCGSPPWFVSGGLFGATGRRHDLESLYDDVLVAIDAPRGINNGQPSLHARAIEALALHEGETVLHVGAGAGYYTAILARLVGPAGKVIAYEIETDIAERARVNLAPYPQVEVRAQSGAGLQPAAEGIEVRRRSGGESLPKADAIYVNAAASHPLKAWLEALNPGGRLLFPLQAAHSTGGMLLITRPPGENDHWGARMLCGVVFIACEGGQDREIGRRLDLAFRTGTHSVRSLRFGSDLRETDWLRGDGWALSAEPAGGGADEE